MIAPFRTAERDEAYVLFKNVSPSDASAKRILQKPSVKAEKSVMQWQSCRVDRSKQKKKMQKEYNKNQIVTASNLSVKSSQYVT